MMHIPCSDPFHDHYLCKLFNEGVPTVQQERARFDGGCLWLLVEGAAFSNDAFCAMCSNGMP